MIAASLVVLAVGFCSLSAGLLVDAGIIAPRPTSAHAHLRGRPFLIAGGVAMIVGFLLGSAAIGFHVPDPTGHVFQW